MPPWLWNTLISWLPFVVIMGAWLLLCRNQRTKVQAINEEILTLARAQMELHRETNEHLRAIKASLASDVTKG